MANDHEQIEVAGDRSEVPSVVLHFPGGRPSNKNKAEHGIYVKRDGSVAVVREEPSNSVVYVGTTSSNAKRPCRYVLGGYNKRLRTLKLQRVLGEGVVRMEPRIDGLQYKPSGIVSEWIEGTETERKRQGSASALATFGGSISKKKLMAAELNLPAKESTEGNDLLEVMVQSIGSKSQAEGLTKKQVFESTAESRIMPPHHEEGRTLAEAFVFDELCPTFYQSLFPVDVYLRAAESNREMMVLRSKGESAFVLHCLRRVSGMSQDGKRSFVVKLCFLSALIKLQRLHGGLRHISKNTVPAFAQKHEMDLQLLEFFISLFYQERNSNSVVKYEMPESKTKLVCSYTLVTALMVCDSEMNQESVDMLRTEMKVSRKVMADSFQCLGARIIRQAKKLAFHVRILKDGKTLKESLPKLMDKQGPRRKRY